MAVSSLGVYTGNHKPYDHVGNVTPDFEVSEGKVPSEELRPAGWLPVQLWDKHFEVWKVMTAGKIVSLDNAGRVVPAQYGLSGATITYTADDVTAGVLDVRTGVTLLIGDIGTFNVAAVTAFMGGSDALAVSSPIGVLYYDAFQDFGTGDAYDDGTNPVGYRQHNFRLQHLIAVLTDSYIELPLVPASTTATNLGQLTLAAGTTILDSAALGNLPVAKNTVRTPIAFTNGTGTDAATRFVTEVSSRSMILPSGDWFVDLTTGVVSCYGDATIVANTYQIAYYNYAGVPGTVSKFVCAVGNPVPGDFLKADSNSNWTVATPDTPGGAVGGTFGDNLSNIMGQVWATHVLPKDYLDRVRSAHLPALATDATGALPGYDGQFDQTAGTATGGVPIKIHYAGGANLLVRVNLFNR